jgi:3-(3-hydroxy-phenyl)propionate hydroxylase
MSPAVASPFTRSRIHPFTASKMFEQPRYQYLRPRELDGKARHRGAIVVGAGPVGLTAAIDLADRGQPVLLLDDDDTVSVGSRAICYSKRTLEILDRLGCGEAIAGKGVSWSVGKVFHGDTLAYRFDLLPEPGHHRPAFVNLQQYHFETCLVERARSLANLEMRWRHKVCAVTQDARGVALTVSTGDGDYGLTCDWLVVCDGARSPIRTMLGLDFEGRVFRDRFLIADIHMTSDFPVERRFWFDPPFHRNQSVLLHRQSDDIWRVDFQLGWDADPELERQPERIEPRLRAMLGDDARFTIVWSSVYTFQCRRMQKFRHGRLIFAGDAAHLVSPFGARGANSGIQDTDNLGWKLDLVMRGLAPESLLDTYDSERVAAADENLRNSARSTDFITPKSAISRAFRDAVLQLSRRHPFARTLVNSGRLSVPAVLSDSPLNTADEDAFEGKMIPGAVAADAPVDGPCGAWLLQHLGRDFTLMTFGPVVDEETRASLAAASVPVRVVQIGGPGGVRDLEGLVASRYDARDGTCYLLRPDQHVCARWRRFDRAKVDAALARATGK